MAKRNRRRPRVKITGGGSGIVNHVGARAVTDLADQAGLTSALSTAMAPTRQRRRGHDRGDVLVDVAVMLADGGEAISDLATLRDQPDMFGQVASHPTVWRTLAAVDDAVLERVKTARAQARANAGAAGVDPGFYVIDIDATLVGAHSDKERAAPTYKRTFGFHPLLAYLDATGEALAGLLRPGNAGSGTAADHVTVLGDALAQLPIDPGDDGVEVIVRADTAGWSHGFVNECRDRHVNFVIGHRLTVDIAKLLVKVPKRAWQPAISADGSDWRDHAEVVETPRRHARRSPQSRLPAVRVEPRCRRARIGTETTARADAGAVDRHSSGFSRGRRRGPGGSQFQMYSASMLGQVRYRWRRR